MIISLSGYAGSGKDTVGKIIQYHTWMHKHNIKLEELNKHQSVKVWVMANHIEGWGRIDFDTASSWTLSDWQIRKWATALRKVAAILLGMDEQFLYTDEFKKMELPVKWFAWGLKVVSGKFEGKYLSTYKPFDTREDAEKYRLSVFEPDKFEVVHRPMTGREFLQRLGTDAVRNGLHVNTWVNALMSQYKAVGFMIFPNWVITDTRFLNELTAVKDAGGVTIRVNRGQPANQHPSETALDNVQFDYTIDNNGTIEELSEQVASILKSLNI